MFVSFFPQAALYIDDVALLFNVRWYILSSPKYKDHINIFRSSIIMDSKRHDGFFFQNDILTCS